MPLPYYTPPARHPTSLGLQRRQAEARVASEIRRSDVSRRATEELARGLNARLYAAERAVSLAMAAAAEALQSSAAPQAPEATVGNTDGGEADTNYGGLEIFDGGGVD